MPRFRKGTTDHDSDGRMGGSMKETDMAEKKTPAKAKAADTEDSPLVAMEAEARAAAAKDAGEDSAPLPKDERAKFNEMFAEADAKAQAAISEEARVGIEVRGY